MLGTYRYILMGVGVIYQNIKLVCEKDLILTRHINP